MFVLLFDDDQWFVKFYWLIIFDQNCFYSICFVSFDLVYYFYGFNDVQGIVYVYFLVYFDECFCVWVWGVVESINYWGVYDVIIDFCCGRCFYCWSSCWCDSVRQSGLLYYWCCISLLYYWKIGVCCCVVDVNRFFVFRNFQFGDI